MTDLRATLLSNGQSIGVYETECTCADEMFTPAPALYRGARMTVCLQCRSLWNTTDRVGNPRGSFWRRHFGAQRS